MLLKAAATRLRQRAPRPLAGRVEVDGKQFALGDQRFAFRGVTYGTFRPRDDDGARFPESDLAERDFAGIAEAGFTVVRTYTEPPDDLIDLAADWGLKILAGVFWPDWRYLVGASRRQVERVGREARQAVRGATRRFAGSDEVLALTLGNEIPADVLRWTGTSRVAKLIGELVEVVKTEDPSRLVTYANYPTAEYLPLDGVDFLTFNIFLDRPQDFRRYLTRLHHLAGDRPLVLGELGLHAGHSTQSERHQAETIDWQLRTALERGSAGTCVFSWTDEWWVGDQAVEGWHFGLTRADRSARPALEVAATSNARTVADLRDDWPRLSVVICAYNAQETLDECLRHTCALDYPGLEIVVVDDGSTDATAAIAATHTRARLHTVRHAGLGSARNQGMRLSRGDVVAYLDADAYPPPEWPYYLVLGFDERDVAATGGPNVPPPDDPPGAQVVARAPGGPVHVLTADDRAEHVPGCNMAFWRYALEAIGGWDPVYTSAGDDVDACWKILDRAWEIGFHPAALVWHHRRPGLGPYLRQQRGYGRAEALVEARHPNRFSAVGTARWRGRIYTSLAGPAGTQRIYRGPFGTASYQSVYRQDAHALDLVHQVGLPIAAAAIATAPLGFVAHVLVLPAAFAAVLVGALFALDVGRARPPRDLRRGRLRFCAAVAVHELLQPLVRWWGRRTTTAAACRELTPQRLLPAARAAPGGGLLYREDVPRAELAEALIASLRSRGLRAVPAGEWDDHDASIRASWLLHGELVTACHPPGWIQARLRRRAQVLRLGLVASVATLVAFADPAWVGVVGAACAADLTRGWWRTRIRSRVPLESP